jgi:hypothetical protein|tara:strand:- start:992 stop:1873 length:882 start_codon:yes stop_codon:yes gene_type:complete
MANYAVQKAKYGGVTGTIQVFVSQLPDGNDPNAGDFREKLPAGFLRCDGSIFKAELFPELAKVIGIGEDCKFAKDPENIGADEIQLPDLGSKYLVPGNATGTYLSEKLSDGNTARIGAEFAVKSNVGSSETITYSGNFTIDGETGDIEGNPLYSSKKENTFTGVITDRHFQGHGHLANQLVTNCTGNYQISPGTGPERPGNSHSGNNCKATGGNALYFIGTPEGSGAISASHEHLIQIPTSGQDYTHNLQYTYPTTQIGTQNLRTTINIITEDVKTFDTALAPYIIVEYIIKF